MIRSALDSRISRVRIVTRPSNPVDALDAFAARPVADAAAGSGKDGDRVTASELSDTARC
jgi:hypothetical protein